MKVEGANQQPYFVVENPFTRQRETLPIEDWREGWKPSGKLVNNGLPVIRLHDPGGVSFALVRPHYVLNRAGDRMISRPMGAGDPEPLLAFVSPIFTPESIGQRMREQTDGERDLGPPVFDKPLQEMPQDRTEPANGMGQRPARR